ncbi:hypothetical protein DV096_00415 [Bradymonadaceae bacterium TMQ3]|uniref:Uncharacterized protein n=1 Tax=Lujinxingia sediminis TaxID=2480984 RepID=A0ABY0CYY6_9DELT|nr:hypothetical protein [Lujinxingia sediminis]RDV39070.1 hypothetical protein DV096_00415 [Bradymonadaceae bacterium TMQ3]RVU48883.1 hypothetical protein EA187_05505 [Lujinxingia sediminis]TXC78177.1 hypothetical protein FRC91_05470 [Bradymonadales bacterium TMQ1]
MSVNFGDELSKFENALAEKRQELEELRKMRDTHSLQTSEARNAIEHLRAALRGEAPPGRGRGRKKVRGVSSLPVDPETQRPPRGARRQQILEICRQLGTKHEQFRTADVLKALGRIEGEVTDGIRSYTYSVVNTFEKEGLMEKIGRGRWKWNG